MLVTTEKDWVRLPDGDGSDAAELKHRSRPFAIAIEFVELDEEVGHGDSRFCEARLNRPRLAAATAKGPGAWLASRRPRRAR